MSRLVLRRWQWLALAGAAVSVLIAAPGAHGASSVASLRVEAAGRPLDRGISYATGAARLPTSRRECGGSGRRYLVRRASAVGIVDHARRFNRRLRPFFVSDRFGFGLIACRIGAFGAFGASEAWLYRLNHRDPGVAADQARLRGGDQVLWYFANFAAGANTGAELRLVAPARARRGSLFSVTAFAYDSAGKRTPAAGVRLRGGASAVTGPDGSARIRAARDGQLQLRGSRANDIPTQPLAVCVNRRLAACPRFRGATIVGTRAADRLRGTRGRDLVIGRGGADRIDVRGGDRDRVRCGPGRAVVLADRRDRVARNCKLVTRSCLARSTAR